MSRNDFGQDLVKACDDKQKVKGNAMNLYKTITTFNNFESLTKSPPKAPPSSIEECDEPYLYEIVDELTK